MNRSVLLMGLKNLFGWGKKKSPPASACGASDKPAACGASDKPAACGAGDADK
jgi:ACGX-repeat protein